MSDLETVEAFRERARTWIRANLENSPVQLFQPLFRTSFPA